MDPVEDLVKKLREYNAAYRAGNPVISDQEYDQLVEKLRELDPSHAFLHMVEPEAFEARREIRHPVPMLSTEKAYTLEALERYVLRVQKAADEIGHEQIRFMVTPKLDGLAGRDDGLVFASRGNGEIGYEISSAFQKGIIPIGGRGLGLGEIVIVQSYFEANLSDEFEHPRNMVVGIIASDTLNDFAVKALSDGMVHFVPYSMLPQWKGSGEQLLSRIDEITADLTAKTDYPLDGLVVSVIDEPIRQHMGATAHHYRWQIAVKTKGQTARTIVKDIIWQVGRTGSVTPVLEIEPVALSGATLRRVTGHNAGMIKKNHIGAGAEIEVIRSGEVIPKLEKVIHPSEMVSIPTACPACGKDLHWDRDFLKCLNPNCKAQIVQSIHHWFKILGNADWFGIKTIEKLVNQGYDSLEKIYDMSEPDFNDLGFGPVQSKNLSEAIDTSKSKPVEDWRFLAAFGIPDLGIADSRRLLSHMALEDLLLSTAEQVEKIDGFGPITSRAIAEGIATLRSTIEHMIQIGFALERTSISEPANIPDNPIYNRGIVFTGKMMRGTREEMQNEARSYGAIVQTGVSSKTHYLVCGENVGNSKMRKARQAGAKIISEAEYNEMIASMNESERGEYGSKS